MKSLPSLLKKILMQIQVSLSSINIPYFPGGTKLKIEYADTSFILNNYEIRRLLGWPPGNSLKSNLFYFDQSSDSTLTLFGGGFGHGVGMCQWGAMNMSERGFKYYHILSKYFPGTILMRAY